MQKYQGNTFYVAGSRHTQTQSKSYLKEKFGAMVAFSVVIYTQKFMCSFLTVFIWRKKIHIYCKSLDITSCLRHMKERKH